VQLAGSGQHTFAGRLTLLTSTVYYFVKPGETALLFRGLHKRGDNGHLDAALDSVLN
jgi:hypothetical protein